MTDKDDGNYVAPGFESVRELFFRNSFGQEQCCVYYKGQMVVNLCDSRGTSYNTDTICNVFSTGKTVCSIVIATLVDEGLLAYDDKIAKHWPEFGRHGKESITIADCLRHEAGLDVVDKGPVPLEDLSRESIRENKLGRVFEEKKLDYDEVKGKRSYHVMTRDTILNEVVRRVGGKRTIGELLKEKVSDVLGVDVHVGLVSDEQNANVLDIAARPNHALFELFVPSFLSGWGPTHGRLLSVIYLASCLVRGSKDPPFFVDLPKKDPAEFCKKCNAPVWRKGELPSVNTHASAKGLAKLGACMANGGELEGKRVLSKAVCDEMQGGVVKRFDDFIQLHTSFSQGGVCTYKIHDEDVKGAPIGRPTFATSFAEKRAEFVGWNGYGGSVFQWHNRLKLGFSFVPTKLEWFDPLQLKAANLQKEVVECIGRLEHTAGSQ